MKEDLTLMNAVLTAAVPALILLLTWVAKYLAALFEAKTNEVQENIKNKKVKEAINIVSEDAINIVLTLNQTIVEGLKAASVDGKLTVEEAAGIKTKALNMLKSTLTTDVRDTLGMVYSDIDSYLETVIEKTVVQVKTAK